MLLVALVALGSATFAWFSESTVANAQGFKATAVAAKGIAVLSESEEAAGGNWSVNTKLRAISSSGSIISNTNDFILTPASYNFTVADGETNPTGGFFKTTSHDPGVAVPTNNPTVTGATPSYSATTASVYGEKVKVKVNGEAATVKITSVTLTDPASVNDDLQPALRVLIVNDTGEVIYYSGPTFTATNYLTATGSYNSVKSSATKAAVPLASGGTSIGEVATNGSDYVMVYVFLDGEDAACTSNNVSAASLISNLNIQFELAA